MFHSIFMWRKGFRNHDWIIWGALAAGFSVQTLVMLQRGLSLSHCPINNLFEAFAFVLWTLVLVSLGVSLIARLRFVAAFAAPVIFAIGVFTIMPALDTPYANKPEFHNALRSAHAALGLLSYGAFGLASVAGFMFLTQERDLKHHRLRAFLSLLPPMERMERTISYLAFTGLGLLTLALALTPFLVFEQKTHTRITNDIKVSWSMVVWAAYFLLLLGHVRFGQTGRKLAWGSIGVFAFVLLTFWGINLLSPTHSI